MREQSGSTCCHFTAVGAHGDSPIEVSCCVPRITNETAVVNETRNALAVSYRSCARKRWAAGRQFGDPYLRWAASTPSAMQAAAAPSIKYYLHVCAARRRAPRAASVQRHACPALWGHNYIPRYQAVPLRRITWITMSASRGRDARKSRVLHGACCERQSEKLKLVDSRVARVSRSNEPQGRRLRLCTFTSLHASFHACCMQTQ
jgi:hypothetical protein